MLLTTQRLRALLTISALGCIASPVCAQPAPAPTRPGAELSDEAELRRVQAFYDAGKYVECVREFDTLIGGPKPNLEDPSVLESARVYYAACLIAVGKNAKADDQFRAALRANPRLQPDTLIFPQVVLERFLHIRDEMSEELKKVQAEELARKQKEAAELAARAEAEARRVKRLEDLARRETVVTENHRWIAAVPFGVGQFQNREQALGWIFFGTEVALAATALGALIVESNLNSQADDNLKQAATDELNTKVGTARQVFVFSSWGFIGVSVVGVLQAQLAFVPEFRETRIRKLPPNLRHPEPKKASFSPTAFPTPGGLQLGVVGRF